MLQVNPGGECFGGILLTKARYPRLLLSMGATTEADKSLISMNCLFFSLTKGKFSNMRLASQDAALPKSITLKHRIITFETQFWCSKRNSTLISDSHSRMRFWGSSAKNKVTEFHLLSLFIRRFYMSAVGSIHLK